VESDIEEITCSWCGAYCNKTLGMYREMKIVVWGGPINYRESYDPKVVDYFCTHEHREAYLYHP